MAIHITYLFSLLLITVATLQQTTHAVDYEVVNNAGNSNGGVRFVNEIGVDYARQTLVSSTDFTWRVFQQTTDTEKRNVPKVTLFIEKSIENPPGAVAYAINNEIHYSASSLEGSTGNVKPGFDGVIYHEMTHIWQWNGNGQAPGGLIEGIADFVRLRANFIPSHWVQPGEGTSWDQGYDVTARFLDYCNGLKNGFVAELNMKMRNEYNDNFFVDILGKNVNQLWSDYKAYYGKSA